VSQSTMTKGHANLTYYATSNFSAAVSDILVCTGATVQVMPGRRSEQALPAGRGHFLRVLLSDFDDLELLRC